MNILFLLEEIPFPITNGPRAKVFSLLAYLSKKHQCYVLAFCDEVNEAAKCSAIQALPQVRFVDIFPRNKGLILFMRRMWNILSGLPPSFALYSKEGFINTFRKTCEGSFIDIVYYDLVNMAQFFDQASNLPSVHSPNDATSRNYFLQFSELGVSWRKIYVGLSALLLQNYEKKTYHRFRRLHVVSEESANYLKKIDRRLEDSIEVIPISAGAKFLQMPISMRSDNLAVSYPRILFSGNLSNTGVSNGLMEFIDKSLNIICQEFPNLKFKVLTGGHMPPHVKKRIKRISCVEVVSWVDDYRQILAENDLTVVPDKTGPGPKTRILQALAAGLPVVAFYKALEGISYENEVHLVECSDFKRMGYKVVELLKSPGKRYTMALKGRQLIDAFYSPEIIERRWLKLFEDLKPTL